MNILNKLTKNYLMLNKKRTIVTIIGIILSGAMITAVATLAVSFQSFMLNAEIQIDGAWEANFKNVSTQEKDVVAKDTRWKNVMMMAPVGIAKNTYSQNPYVYIKAYDQSALENMKIRLVEGRLPQNENEILLSKTFFDGNEKQPQIGDTVTWTMGKRVDGTEELIGQKQTETETFVSTGEKTYTICGRIERPDFETSREYYTAGVTLLSNPSAITSETIDIGIISKKANNLYKDVKEVTKELEKNKEEETEQKVNYNTYVLAYKGVNSDNGFNNMLYSVCGILIAVIMVGSILVIYNSFAISISERKKQFGMLASVGATKKQIKKSVLYEGVVLGSIGIPIGILAGIGGIGITLKIVNQLLQPTFVKDLGNLNLELVVSWPSIILAAILIAVTIYLSVMVPARRASKITPIEAIRQSEDIKIKAKKLRTPKWFRKLFGIEGEMALKNLKRSKKRYRTTVVSLIISIVLFVSVSGFIDYMYSGFDSLYQTVDYEYQVSIYGSEQQEKKAQVKEQLQNLKGVNELTITEQIHCVTQIPENRLDNTIQKELKENGALKQMFSKAEEGYDISVMVLSLNEKQMKNYLKEVGVNALQDGQIILINYVDLLRSAKIEGSLTNYKEKEILKLTQGEEEKIELEMVKVTDKMPFGISNTYPSLIAITTQKGVEKIAQQREQSSYTTAYMTAKNEKELQQELKEIEQSATSMDINVQNIKEQMETQKNLKLIIQIFLYGFIALISAIGIANIFNTISTNINLRRREFAMLKSIGMTDRSFRKMLNLECVFYGTKALLYGLPIGIGVCYLINRGFGNLLEFAFHLPWSAILISIIGVYLIVYMTMLYSSKKVKKENIIDVLRDENV